MGIGGGVVSNVLIVSNEALEQGEKAPKEILKEAIALSSENLSFEAIHPVSRSKIHVYTQQIKHADLAIVCCDLANPKPDLNNWVEEMERYEKSHIPIVVVGINNGSKDARQNQEIKEKAKELGCQYIELSLADLQSQAKMKEIAETLTQRLKESISSESQEPQIESHITSSNKTSAGSMLRSAANWLANNLSKGVSVLSGLFRGSKGSSKIEDVNVAKPPTTPTSTVSSSASGSGPFGSERHTILSQYQTPKTETGAKLEENSSKPKDGTDKKRHHTL